MLLAIDIGNTQVVIGLFEGERLRAHWRIATKWEQTEDELAAILSDLFQFESLDFRAVDRMIIASVVPSLTESFVSMARKFAGAEPMVVGPQTKSGISVLYRNPEEVGADRIVNAVAGHALCGGSLIIVDFGTATTFDAVTARGEYLGGAIAPGVLVSAEALFSRAARLSRFDLVRPETAIGKDTKSSVQSGVLLGSAGMVDSLVRRIAAEMGGVDDVLATGGLAELIAPACETITRYEPHLTLLGLRMIFDKNA